MLEKTNIICNDRKQMSGCLEPEVGVGIDWHKERFLYDGTSSKIDFGGGYECITCQNSWICKIKVDAFYLMSTLPQ